MGNGVIYIVEYTGTQHSIWHRIKEPITFIISNHISDNNKTDSQ